MVIEKQIANGPRDIKDVVISFSTFPPYIVLMKHFQVADMYLIYKGSTLLVKGTAVFKLFTYPFKPLQNCSSISTLKGNTFVCFKRKCPNIKDEKNPN